MFKELIKTNLGIFRIIAFFEGISLLLIFFVSMPLKYIWDMPEANMVFGMIHGLLFLLYCLFLIVVKLEYKWSWRKSILAFIASFLPFGTFIADKRLFAEK